MRLGANGLAAFVTPENKRGMCGFRPTTFFAGHVPLQGRLVLEGCLAGSADVNHSRARHGCKTTKTGGICHMMRFFECHAAVQEPKGPLEAA